MRVFVTGATGYIGSALVAELMDAGHQVVGLARSDNGAAVLKKTGAEVHWGALDDLDSLQAAPPLRTASFTWRLRTTSQTSSAHSLLIYAPSGQLGRQSRTPASRW